MAFIYKSLWCVICVLKALRNLIGFWVCNVSIIRIWADFWSYNLYVVNLSEGWWTQPRCSIKGSVQLLIGGPTPAFLPSSVCQVCFSLWTCLFVCVSLIGSLILVLSPHFGHFCFISLVFICSFWSRFIKFVQSTLLFPGLEILFNYSSAGLLVASVAAFCRFLLLCFREFLFLLLIFSAASVSSGGRRGTVVRTSLLLHASRHWGTFSAWFVVIALVFRAPRPVGR